MRRLLFIVLLVVGCAGAPVKQDPTFALQEVTITEKWSDGQIEKKFVRVTKKELDRLSEAEKILWQIIKKQVGL